MNVILLLPKKGFYLGLGKGGGNMRKKQSGFTLIELLVVVGILAVLLAIVLVAINPSRQFRQANNTRRSADVSTILNAITQYGADNRGAYPSGVFAEAGSPLQLRNTDTDGSDTADAGALCALIVPNYIASLPADPTTGTSVMPTTAEACTTTVWDTGYTVTINTAGRITVSATGENPNTGGSLPISVTR